jgi:hypothetical protein
LGRIEKWVMCVLGLLRKDIKSKTVVNTPEERRTYTLKKIDETRIRLMELEENCRFNFEERELSESNKRFWEGRYSASHEAVRIINDVINDENFDKG